MTIASTALPLDIGAIHFVGIGGIGMSGIAEVMINRGHSVQGSDLKEGPTVERLRTLGARIFIGQHAQNLERARVVVVSSAIKDDNPELAAARALNLPIVRRAEMLAELMRLKWNVAVAGTHGKTTTTSMVAAMLDAGGVDPTVINGGVIQSYGSNARLGEGDWMVVEADESDGTFVKLPATIAIVTNIDPEHMEHYGSFDSLRAAFKTFVENTPFYGAGVCCIDHPEVQTLIGRIRDRRIVTYGFSPQADIRGRRLSFENGCSTFDVEIRSRFDEPELKMEGLRLPMPGEHNVLNSLAAIAVARQLKIGPEAIAKALSNFGGVKRRFTRVGTWNGVGIVDDYGHHPVEITAVMRAARESVKKAGGRVIAVHQPHRYSRLKDLFDEFCSCFNDADVVAISPVFPAGEAPLPGYGRDTLVEGLRAHGHRNVQAISGADDLPGLVRSHAKEGDLIVFLGAGDITRWANGLQAALQSTETG